MGRLPRRDLYAQILLHVVIEWTLWYAFCGCNINNLIGLHSKNVQYVVSLPPYSLTVSSKPSFVGTCGFHRTICCSWVFRIKQLVPFIFGGLPQIFLYLSPFSLRLYLAPKNDGRVQPNGSLFWHEYLKRHL